MKLRNLASSLFLCALLAAQSVPVASWACEGESHADATSEHAKEPSLALTESGPKRALFEVHGIMCRSCEKKIQAALQGVAGVKSVTFLKAGSKNTRIAQVTFRNGRHVDAQTLAHAVQDAGYQMTIQ